MVLTATSAAVEGEEVMVTVLLTIIAVLLFIIALPNSRHHLQGL
jgi:hypothetical protein